MRISKKPNGEEEADASHSVEDQRARCEALCEAAGYEIVARYVDDGVSAYRSRRDRPGYGELKGALADRSFDVLVFDRQDRLARDQRETMRFIADCGDAGIGWHSQQEGVIDLDDTFSVLRAIFKGTEAQEYSSKISTNSRERNEAKRKQGLPGAGQRPFGWTKARRDDGYAQTLIPDEADLVRQGVEMILAGASVYQVMKVFRDSGVKTVRGNEWQAASVRTVLRRWRNAGWVEHDDKPYAEAKWPEIVSKDDVENVRQIMDRGRIAGLWRTPTMLCSGIARCHCGLTIMVTGNDGVTAYRCSGIINGRAEPGIKHVTIRAALLDPRVRDGVIDAYFTRPASSQAGRAEASSLARLYERRAGFLADRQHAQDGYDAKVYNATEAAAKVADADAAVAAVDAEIRAAAAQSAHAAMLEASMNALVVDLDVTADPAKDDGTHHFGLGLVQSAMRDGASRDDALNALARFPWSTLDENGEPVWRVDPAIREAVAERFDRMDLEQQRHLVRSLVRVEVQPGRGDKRVAVVPV